jgi:ABC-2 type transport system permease protein
VPAASGVPTSVSAGGGSIYDLGYRGYEGPRLGRQAAVVALLTHSLRTAYGLGRSARSKIMPVAIVLMALLPSLVMLGLFAAAAQAGPASEAFEAIVPIRYSTLFPFMAPLVFLFCASQAPELFGRDQRAGVLPLYFSRAVTRFDYAAARTLGLMASLLVLVLLPQLALLAGRALIAADPVAGLVDELPQQPAMLAVGLLIVALVGSVSAATASLTPRRAYATVAIIAIFLIPNIAATLLVELDTGVIGQLAVLVSPADILDGVNAFLFDVRSENSAVEGAGLDGWVYLAAALAWIVGSLVVLLLRYRRIET